MIKVVYQIAVTVKISDNAAFRNRNEIQIEPGRGTKNTIIITIASNDVKSYYDSSEIILKFNQTFIEG